MTPSITRVVLRLLVAAAAMSSASGCAHLVVLHDPLTASEHNDLGVAYESGGQPSLAAKEYKKALRPNPHASRTWVNLGNAQAAQEQWHAAEKSYRHALRDSASNSDAMNNLAVVIHRQGGREVEAIALATRAVAVGGERDSVYRETLREVSKR